MENIFAIRYPELAEKLTWPNENSLVVRFPELAAEWHPTKNGELSPKIVAYGSEKKVWWMCSQGHEWQATVNNRTNHKSGCPYCAGKKAIVGETDLATTHPELAAEWHPTKNGELTPRDVTTSSNRKFWWMCHKGHEWETTVNHRTRGDGCPFCSGLRPILGETDLPTTHPELAAEWHPTKNGELTPQMFSRGSNKKVWWQCSKGHEWQAVVNNRSYGYDCPFCSGLRPILGETDLAATHPKLAAEWHPTKNGELTPQATKAGSTKKVWWLCDKGHEWESQIQDRTRGNGCPYCSGRYAIAGETDLATTNPELIAEWHPTKNKGLTMTGLKRQSGKKVWWTCSKGHEWQAAIYSRVSGAGCPVCAGEMQTSFPEQAILYYFKKVTVAESRNAAFGKEIDVWLPELRIGIEYNGFWHSDEEKDAEKVAYFAEQNIRIITVKESTQNRVIGDTVEYVYHNFNKDSLTWAITSLFQLLQFPSTDINVSANTSEIYEQYIQGEKQNSLAAKFPEIAAEWHPSKNGKLAPEMVAAKSNKRVWWMCSQGHEWNSFISQRTHKGAGCPYCSNQKILPGDNDLASTHPELAAEWHPTKNGILRPAEVTPGTNKKVWWQCPQGHEWQAVIYSRAAGVGCPYCTGKKAIPGANDLASTHPELAAQWHPTKNGELTPRDVKAGSNEKVWWMCSQGHEWQTAVYNRKRCGCPVCGRKKQWETRRKNNAKEQENESK